MRPRATIVLLLNATTCNPVVNTKQANNFTWGWGGTNPLAIRYGTRIGPGGNRPNGVFKRDRLRDFMQAYRGWLLSTIP